MIKRLMLYGIFVLMLMGGMGVSSAFAMIEEDKKDTFYRESVIVRKEENTHQISYDFSPRPSKCQKRLISKEEINLICKRSKEFLQVLGRYHPKKGIIFMRISFVEKLLEKNREMKSNRKPCLLRSQSSAPFSLPTLKKEEKEDS